MHFDALTLAAVTAELRATVENGRVQQVLMVDAHSVGMEIYAARQRHYLLLAMQPGAARIHLMPEKLRRGVDQQTPLYLLLRKYVRGSVLAHIDQPDPTERVLQLDFDHPEHGTTRLVAEPMGRAANLMLLGPDGRILDAMRRVRADEDAREIRPGRTYTPPPAQDKLPPLDDGATTITPTCSACSWSRGRCGVRSWPVWPGCHPRRRGKWPGARRGTPRRARPAWPCRRWCKPCRSCGRRCATAWTPGVWQDDDGTVIGFSPYPAHVKGTFMPTASISTAVARYFATSISVADPYAGQRRTVARALDAATRKVTRRLDALAGDAPAPGEVEALRTQAEWLLALSSQITPGQTELAVPLGDAPDATLRIPLDGKHTPVEQAQRMFQRGQLARAAEFIPQRQAQLQADLAQLDQLRVDLTLAENQPEIAAVQDELRALGLTPRSRTANLRATAANPCASTTKAVWRSWSAAMRARMRSSRSRSPARRSLAARAQCPRRPRGHPPGRADAQPSMHRGRGTVGGVLLQGAG
ncbi:MAG: NFACT family protein [Caldilineaceae bacterium]